MTQKMNLDVQTIIDKKFNIDYKDKGYNAGEVDEFIEQIIEKMRKDQAIIECLQRENTSLMAKVTELEAKNQAEIGERISLLEKEVRMLKDQNKGAKDDVLPVTADKSTD